MVDRLRYRAPCEQRPGPAGSVTLARLRSSGAWQAHEEQLATAEPYDSWRELCWRFFAFERAMGPMSCSRSISAGGVRPYGWRWSATRTAASAGLYARIGLTLDSAIEPSTKDDMTLLGYLASPLDSPIED